MEERDPLKSQALESSLWELQALQSHILPSVATAAKFISMPMPSVEWDMSKTLENVADDVSKTIMWQRYISLCILGYSCTALAEYSVPMGV
jgi:hypothetical protein